MASTQNTTSVQKLGKAVTHVVGDLQVDGNVILSTPLTVANVDQSVTSFQKTVLTAAQVLAMSVTPVAVTPTPPAGKTVVVKAILVRLIFNTTAFAAGGAVSFLYNGTGAATTATIANTVINGTSSADIVKVAVDAVATQAVPIKITNATGAFTTGDSNLEVTVFFAIT